MLPAGEHVRATYLGADGILDAVRPGTLLIDSSTVDVATAREVAADPHFRERGTDTRLGAESTDSDFAFSFTYGLGYSFSPNFQVDVVQDLGTSLHQGTNLAAGEDRSARRVRTGEVECECCSVHVVTPFVS